MKHYVAILVLVFFFVVIVFIAALVGFIFVQIKARLVWRLLSLALVLAVSCWLCFEYGRWQIFSQCVDTSQECKEFVYALDQMTIEGRTNDIHQSCQKFLDVFFFTTEPHEVSNFDRLVANTSKLAFEQSNTTFTLTAPMSMVSTNK